MASENPYYLEQKTGVLTSDLTKAALYELGIEAILEYSPLNQMGLVPTDLRGRGIKKILDHYHLANGVDKETAWERVKFIGKLSRIRGDKRVEELKPDGDFLTYRIKLSENMSASEIEGLLNQYLHPAELVDSDPKSGEPAFDYKVAGKIFHVQVYTSIGFIKYAERKRGDPAGIIEDPISTNGLKDRTRARTRKASNP